MSKKYFFKIGSYILSIFLISITIINHVYRVNEKDFLLKPYFVDILCIIYYLFMDYVTKDTSKFDKEKKLILLSIFFYSLFEFVILILHLSLIHI